MCHNFLLFSDSKKEDLIITNYDVSIYISLSFSVSALSNNVKQEAHLTKIRSFLRFVDLEINTFSTITWILAAF